MSTAVDPADGQQPLAPQAPRMTLTVAAVARRLGVAPATLRTWDRRYGLGPSEHTAGAHRRYSSSDLARLVVMRRLTLEGVAPAEAAQLAATTAVADGGFALASVSTIPAAVIEAAVTDAAQIAGPTSGLAPARTAEARPEEPRPDESEDLESRPAAHRRTPHGEGPGEDHRDRRDDLRGETVDWAVASLADRFTDEIRTRGVARAWDAVLGPASATRDAAMHAAVARALSALPTADGERSVLLAGAGTADDRDRTPVLLAAAAALAESGTGARSVGDGVPVRMLAAAVRRVRPPALLLHAEGTGEGAGAARVGDDLEALLRVRPAPLVVLVGDGWPAGERPGVVRAASLEEAVGACAAAVSA
ncbi:MerR family transcriptional regulator [Kineococcus aurantiacus]|uniref:DNA-binding transcriptional MerR regulator n=1 Tax=Kineococcus aurantiacus TaxID=37633 RepID=A0A7Y9DK01_9ACTN|nr:MerR family transcriptional regulator [Kineococcus aurantiacus]NYD21993.1 DNA-binding transcriptional MerR regulator [Kineococcus aurantiacus]